MLEVGTKAPDFTLQNQNGEEVRLTDYRGKKVILYFYSKDKKVYITTADKTTEEFWGKLRDVETQTNGYFLSIHKSFLINCNFVEKYTYDNVQMADGRLLSISPAKRKSVRDAVLQMIQG